MYRLNIFLTLEYILDKYHNKTDKYIKKIKKFAKKTKIMLAFYFALCYNNPC